MHIVGMETEKKVHSHRGDKNEFMPCIKTTGKHKYTGATGTKLFGMPLTIIIYGKVPS